MLKIKRVGNGAVLEDEDGGVEVYEYDEMNMGRLIDLLFEVSEIIAPTSSRYSRERVSVRLVHGDKYECPEKECELCDRR